MFGMKKVEGYFLHKPNLNTKHSLSIENIFVLVPTWVVNKSIRNVNVEYGKYSKLLAFFKKNISFGNYN